MLRIKQLFFALALVLCSSAMYVAQAQNFTGTVKYKVTYTDLPAEYAGMESMLPNESTLLIKGQRSKLTQSMGMAGTQSVLVDAAAGTTQIMLDLMGQKILLNMDKKQMEEGDTEVIKPTINYKKGKKKIAGQKCGLAEVIFQTPEGHVDTTMVWYSKKIQQVSTNEFKGLAGLPMEYTTVSQGMRVTMKAEEVTKGNVTEEDFTVPAEYTPMTMEEFQEMMGQ